MTERAEAARSRAQAGTPLLAWAVAIVAPGLAWAQTPVVDDLEVDELVVVGAPLSEGVPQDRLPAQVRFLGEAFEAPGLRTGSEAIVSRLGSAVSVDSLGNPLQQTVNLRGFTAAPALGEPQGVSVYQGPMRLNEAFGDVVQWDLLPTFAVDQAQVVSGSNPAYGLNTTGGVVTLGMKSGFSAEGGTAELSAGSFGRRSALAEFGHASGDFGVYVGADHLREDGWRDTSPSRMTRVYADFAWRPRADAEVGLGLTAADTQLTGNGPAPLDLLAARRQAVFTYPDVTDTQLYAATLRAEFAPRAGLSFGAGAFVRELTRNTLNGDQAEFEACEDFAGLVPGFAAPEESLCFGAEVEEEDDELEGEPAVLIDRSGRPILGLEDADAVFNRTRTRTLSFGGSSQATWSASLGGRDNILVAGAALEQADTRYDSGSDVGELQADRGVESLGVALGNPEFNVGLKTRSRSLGVYFSDTFSIRPDLHLTGSFRWNRTELRLRDQIGTALNGDHAFERLNLGAGLAWNVTQAVTAYASYAENNRAPTPAELSCADPLTPCRFPNAFLADPPLADVKARSWEAGVRGRSAGLRWSGSVFQTNLADDIIFISAGPIVGTGYFENVGATRREGVELDLSGDTGAISWFASYAHLRATYRTPLRIQAPHNPEAHQDGEIFVERGDRIPGLPLHSLKLGADWRALPELTFRAEVRMTSSRPLRGDEANLTEPLDGFAVANLSATWRLGRLELWARVENLLGAEYETFGIFGDAGELGFDDPRFVSPGAPRASYVGLRAKF